jgi:hypothetical protein
MVYGDMFMFGNLIFEIRAQEIAAIRDFMELLFSDLYQFNDYPIQDFVPKGEQNYAYYRSPLHYHVLRVGALFILVSIFRFPIFALGVASALIVYTHTPGDFDYKVVYFVIDGIKFGHVDLQYITIKADQVDAAQRIQFFFPGGMENTMIDLLNNQPARLFFIEKEYCVLHRDDITTYFLKTQYYQDWLTFHQNLVNQHNIQNLVNKQ